MLESRHSDLSLKIATFYLSTPPARTYFRIWHSIRWKSDLEKLSHNGFKNEKNWLFLVHYLILIVKFIQNCRKNPHFSFRGYIGTLDKKYFFLVFWKLKSSDSTLISNNQNKNSSHHWVLTLNFVYRFWNMVNCDIFMYFEPPGNGLLCHFFTYWKV